MDFKHQTGSTLQLATLRTDALLLVVTPQVLDSGPSNDAATALDPVLKKLIADAVKQGDLALKVGRTLYVHRPHAIAAARLVVAVAANDSAKAFKAAIASALTPLKTAGAQQVLVAALMKTTSQHAQALVVAACDAQYVYRHSKPSAQAAPVWSRYSLVCPKEEAKEVASGILVGQAIASGMGLARECANRPGNLCTPSDLASQAKTLAKKHRLKIEVLDRKAVEKLGMGAFLAVAQGSDEPLRFIVLRYEGAPATAKKAASPPVVLVGKGITFDSGGISIKPAAEMDEMKFDMGGAASVLGAMAAIAELKPKLNLVVIIPSCENLPSGRAVKPGDVVTTMSGQTVEILNTDAEGRLILCDALTYAERFKPRVVVDVATLTGACVIALGHHHSGLFTTDDALAATMLQCSQEALDPCWRMPLDEEYDEGLKSNFADMGNVGSRAGGAITAAMFLKRYTAKYPWVHLDIAGTAWKSGAAKGSTGRPVPLLTHFVLSQQD
ncbi:MAG: leucyl aminopeptidase [Burkholderiales bacterium]